ncbi:MAG: thioredoxin [Candidatus Woykebacteria bacterium RBG_13_40_15]|uniref:Thioredoxin n=1 Tax=Candidatus Woykebacteria bacterium RBG_13_40_15 TaxID=1802593 RepID=A0A1G1W935_9BACT|nr:MAG: thioredoxin [Candidatus Woykebacteria bacterium RBG_13_40_15]
MAIQLLDFYADWCGPCITMKPIVEELEKELASKVEIKKVNVEENKEDSEKYGVMSIPTFLLMENDKELERFVGVTSKEILESKILQHL